jgi:branched-chain amino acid transport system substrate-binding protein
MKARLAAVASTAVLAVAVSACGSSGSSSSTAAAGGSTATGGSSTAKGSPFQILDITALSGPYAATGLPETQATKAAVNYINAHGGADGHQLVLTVKDDQGDASTAVSILEQQVASGNKPNMVIPGVTSDETVALLPILARDDILSIACTGATQISTPGKYPLSFGGSFAPLDGPDSEAAFLKSKGYTDIGVFNADDAYGTSWYSSIAVALQNAGLKFTDVSYDPTALDLSPELGKLEGDHPQAILAEGFGAPVGAIFSARLKLGNFSIPFVADNTISSGDVWTTVNNPTALQNTYMQAYTVGVDTSANTSRPAVQNLLTSIQKLGSISASLSLYALNWDIIQTVKAAIVEAGGSTDPQTLATAMLHLKASDSDWTQNGGAAPGYTSSEHFMVATPQNYTFVSAGPLVDGMIKPAS